MGNNKTLQKVELEGRYSIGYCILGNLAYLILACMVLYSIPTRQTSNGDIEFNATFLAKIIYFAKHENGFTQTLISLETGVAAASIALLTITARNLTDLRFSTLAEMRWEAQRQQTASFLVWVTSLMSSTIAALSTIRIFNSSNTPTDSVLAFLIFLMSSIGVVLPSLLRYEKVGNIGNYSRKLQTLISANKFAKAIGLKIKKTTPSQNGTSLTLGRRFHILCTIVSSSLLALSLITHKFSAEAASILYVTLICVVSLWHLIYILINYFTSGDKTEVAFGATVNLLIFTYSMFTVIHTQWLRNHLDAANHGTIKPLLYTLLFDSTLILIYIYVAFNLIRKQEKMWKVSVIRSAYASKFTKLLEETKSVRRSLENVPKPMQPMDKLLHEWVEDELEIPSNLKKPLKSRGSWEAVIRSKNQPRTNQDFEGKGKSTTPSEEPLKYIPVIFIQIVTAPTKTMSTRQRQQGRAGNVRRLRN